MDRLDTARLLAHLADYPQGISEYELIKNLQAQDYLPHWEPGDTLTLFRVHFLLRHLIYRLRDELWQSQTAHLRIELTQLQLLPYEQGPAQLAPLDSLRSYYLDLGNLTTTTAHQVDDLLDSFWLRYLGADDKQAALVLLGLQEPVSPAQIKQRYRQLASRHHPDRGGDSSTLQTINQAMETLKRHYSL